MKKNEPLLLMAEIELLGVMAYGSCSFPLFGVSE